MSVKLMGRVFDLALITNRKFVLLVLANYADDDGRNVFPTVNTILEKTGLGERTVGRCLSEFRKNCVIIKYDSRKGKRGLIPVYRIQIDRAESVYGLVGDNTAAVAGSHIADDVSPAEGGGSKDATMAGSQTGNPVSVAGNQKRLPATGDRLTATGDTTPCHSLADDSSGTVSGIREDSPPIVPPIPKDDLQEAVSAFNKLANRIGLAKVQNFSDTRRRKLRQRLAECGGIEGWRAALAKVDASTFLTGGGRDGWRADFDFMLQAKSFTKILEGAYDDTPRRDRMPNEIQSAFDRMDSRQKGQG